MMHPSQSNPLPEACADVRDEFTDYLDGAVPGSKMAAIADHLAGCDPCEQEFTGLRTVQQSLAALGAAKAPDRLQARLRQAIASERDRGSHLSIVGRFRIAWTTWLAQATLRASGAFAIALVLLGTLGWMFAAPITSVQANDDDQANLIAPQFMYAQVPPESVSTDSGTPVMIEAKVDTEGRVYDYTILAGPNDPAARLRIEQNLLASVFKPATLFGVPVPGHLVITYTGISVRG